MSTINTLSLRIYVSLTSWNIWQLHVSNKNEDILFAGFAQHNEHIDEYILKAPSQAAYTFDKIYKDGVIDINEDDLDRLISASRINSDIKVIFRNEAIPTTNLSSSGNMWFFVGTQAL